MAKKVKKKLEEDKAVEEFTFPEFDVRGFILHELEQSYATAVALVFGISLAIASWQITLVGLSSSLGVLFFSLGSLGLGVLCALLMVWVVRKVRPLADQYKRGDWAGLVLVYVFLWLGLWALFLNL